MIKGVSISLNGRDYIVPALNMEQLEECEADLELISQRADESGGFRALKERRAAMLRVIHVAVRRNYPDVSLEDVKKWVDLNNLNDVFDAVMGVSGLRKVEPEEGSPSGEAGSASTGTRSTQPSSPTPDGPGSISPSA